jgi:hypothetical protein
MSGRQSRPSTAGGLMLIPPQAFAELPIKPWFATEPMGG